MVFSIYLQTKITDRSVCIHMDSNSKSLFRSIVLPKRKMHNAAFHMFD